MCRYIEDAFPLEAGVVSNPVHSSPEVGIEQHQQLYFDAGLHMSLVRPLISVWKPVVSIHPCTHTHTQRSP